MPSTYSLSPVAPSRERILAALETDGALVVTEGSYDPRHVLPRLLGALAALAPAVYAELTGGGALPTWLPDGALADELHPFWATDDAGERLGELQLALDVAAPAGYSFTFDGEWSRLGFFPSAPAPDAFRPTHLITVRYANTDVEYIPVMLVDGVAYSMREWANDAPATWRRSAAGDWTVRGERLPPGALTVTVCPR